MREESGFLVACCAAALLLLHRQRRATRLRECRRLRRVDTVTLRVLGMMCQANCGATVARALRGVSGVTEASASSLEKIARVSYVRGAVTVAELVDAVEATGFEAKALANPFRRRRELGDAARNSKPRHACLRGAVADGTLAQAFEGVQRHYHEQQLVEYSRYKNWTQSCYMECHGHWSPQVPVTQALADCMRPVLDQCRERFTEWYKELHGLEKVEVVALNSFITKYVPSEGKDEFGKHVDSAKTEGSLILALPTDDPHDWPGLKVWDGPKGADGERPEHHYVLNPGDICCLDSLIWHHGLPISKGTRYVAVVFYQCTWKRVKGAEAQAPSQPKTGS